MKSLESLVLCSIRIYVHGCICAIYLCRNRYIESETWATGALQSGPFCRIVYIVTFLGVS